MLSNDLLAGAQAHGDVVATSLCSAPSPWKCMSSHSCVTSKLFYSDSQQLKDELKVAIARAANQGEDYVIELTNQICMCLQVCRSSL